MGRWRSILRAGEALRSASITPAMLRALPLSAIEAVVFYKRDEWTTDLICCEVESAGRVWTFHEDMDGWPALMAHLSALPSFRRDWYLAVATPAFAACETVAFRRVAAGDGRAR